ncbi:glycosyltransferase [Zunongwangia sp.]|uniref:glycosyltransferase n=1 Tax=Zunongwangia sp. TaxID=1965325 RepID=UPI003AA7D1CE
MRKKLVFFDLISTGHHLEYLYHISENYSLFKHADITFAVNHDFVSIYEDKFGRSVNKGIKINTLTEEESQIFSSKSGFKNYYFQYKKLRSILKLGEYDSCFIMDIYPISFFLSFSRLPCSLAGIYFIPIFKNTKDFSSKLKRSVLKCVIAKNKWNNIFVLNNPTTASILNKEYGVSIFKSLSDPILDLKKLKTIKEDSEVFKINFKNKISFLHFGSLADRKGTLEIIKSLNYLSPEILSNIHIILAGKASRDFENQIKTLIEEFNISNYISFYSGFLSYTEIDYLLTKCSYVLLPYKFSEMSSGIIGHSVNYNTPIISCDNGAIGDILVNYKVGIPIKPTAKDIAKVIRFLKTSDFIIDVELAKKYLQLNSDEEFVNTIIKSVCQ